MINFTEKNVCYDAQEIAKVQIIELYPDIADPLAENMSISDDLFINTESTVDNLKLMIENNYDWAIHTNFKDRNNTYLFWYISEEKLEPRLGKRYNEPGANVEQPLGIGKIVWDLYQFIKNLHNEKLSITIAEFLLLYPEFRGIIRRIHTLASFEYGEVKDNILSKDVLPINMLRFKLSFFGASRFDPKSDRWLRISFFAGAPYFSNLNKDNVDNWGFTTVHSYN